MSRKIIIALCKALLAFNIFIFIASIILIKTIGDQNQTKQILRNSGIYSVAAANLRKSFIQSTNTNTNTNNPIIRGAVNAAITENRIQRISERAINNIYNWFNNDEKEPKIIIDLSPIHQSFADNVASGLTQRLTNLPICPSNSIPNSQDIFTLNCLPKGINIAPLIEQLRQEIIANSNNGTSATQDKSLIESLVKIKKYYNLVHLLPYISLALFILLAILLIYLNKPRYRSLRLLAGITIPYGLMYVIGGWLMPTLSQKSANTFVASLNAQEFSEPIKKILQEIILISSKYLILVGSILLVLGMLSLWLYLRIKKAQNPSNPLPNSSPNNLPPSPQTNSIDKTNNKNN